MHRVPLSGRTLISISLALTVVVTLGFGLATRSAIAQDATAASHPAHLHIGTCDAPGDVIYPLSNVGSEFLMDGTAMAGEIVGPASAIPVESSQTTVQSSLADIVAGGHTLVVHESDAAIQNYIACGDVGGGMMGPADLAFGLAPLNDSGYSGVAWLRDNGDGTTLVTVFLTGSGEEEPTAEAPAGGAAVAAAIEGFAFNPPTLEISAGDTVIWTNNDGTNHTVTQDGGGFQSGSIAGGGTFSQTFDTPGTFAYHCEFHPMNGTVIVS